MKKQVLDTGTLMHLIRRKRDFYRKKGTKMYILSYVTVFNAPLSSTIKLINDGLLYYDEEEG